MKTTQYKPGQLINTKRHGLFRVTKGRGRECEFKGIDGRCINHSICLFKLPFGCILKKVTPKSN